MEVGWHDCGHACGCVVVGGWPREPLAVRRHVGNTGARATDGGARRTRVGQRPRRRWGDLTFFTPREEAKRGGAASAWQRRASGRLRAAALSHWPADGVREAATPGNTTGSNSWSRPARPSPSQRSISPLGKTVWRAARAARSTPTRSDARSTSSRRSSARSDSVRGPPVRQPPPPMRRPGTFIQFPGGAAW